MRIKKFKNGQVHHFAHFIIMIHLRSAFLCGKVVNDIIKNNNHNNTQMYQKSSKESHSAATWATAQ